MSDTVQFINNLSGASGAPHSHSHGDGPSHSHGADEHGHTHEHLDHPGKYTSGQLHVREGGALPERCVQASMRSAICPTIRRVTSRSAGSPLGSAGMCASVMLVSCLLRARVLICHIVRPVGSGKTALTLALCQKLRKEFNIGM